MPLPSSISRSALIDRLKELGFDGPHAGTGKHPEFMRRGALTLRLPNTHKRKDIGRTLLKRILQQGSITVEEWLGGPDDDEAEAEPANGNNPE